MRASGVLGPSSAAGHNAGNNYSGGECHQTTQLNVAHIPLMTGHDVWSVITDADYSTRTTIQTIRGILP